MNPLSGLHAKSIPIAHATSDWQQTASPKVPNVDVNYQDCHPIELTEAYACEPESTSEQNEISTPTYTQFTYY